ncbi:MAG: hypothetical protein IJK89_13390 [Clostridia bacterium]|nr:hypothetical protein [Clostridia bacterium]
MADWFEKLKARIKGRPAGEKKPLLILGIGLVGMLCLLLSGGGSKTEKKDAPPDTAGAQETVTKQLEALLRTVDGVGKVKVYVTVERLQANVYAVNTEQSSEPDRAERNEKYVLTETGNDTEGLVLYTVTPQIRGVAVSCEGGGSGVVRQEVTKLISAALGISANRIWVTKMQT